MNVRFNLSEARFEVSVASGFQQWGDPDLCHVF